MVSDMPSQPVRVLYIAGFGRSGSTLLERILGQVPDFVPVGELKYIWERGFQNDELCSCGQPFADCPFWAQVFDHSFASSNRSALARLAEVERRRDRIRYVPALRLPRLRGSGFHQDFAVFQDALARLYRGVLEVSGARLLVDSSKDPVYGFSLASVSDITLHVVHLTRDSRAVAHSWGRRVIRPEVRGRVEYMGRLGPGATAQRWNVKNTLAELLKKHSCSYMRIRYEDLVSDPISTMRHIFQLLGEPEATMPFVARERYVVDALSSYHSVSGNPIRLERGPLPLRMDDAWRTEMSRGSRLAVTTLTFPLLLRYGYDLSTG